MTGFMKKVKNRGVVVLIGLLSMGMGAIGVTDPTQVPDVAENYAVTVVDQSDVSIALEHFSFDGRTFLLGKLGKAQISVEFEKIQSVLFMKQDQDVKARVRLKNGEVIEIFIENRKPFFGVASFGNVRIEAQDIKAITFERKVENKS